MTDLAARSLVRPLTVVSGGLACFLASENAGVPERIVTGGGKTASKLPQFKAATTQPRGCHERTGAGVATELQRERIAEALRRQTTWKPGSSTCLRSDPARDRADPSITS